MAEYTVKHTGSNTAEIAFSWPQSCEAGQHLHALTKVAAAKKYGNSGGGDNDDGEKRDSALFCPYSAEKTNRLLVAAIAMLSSKGCQLICKIFLL